MAHDRKPPWGLIVLAVIFALVMGTCVAVCDDDDSDRDSMPALVQKGREDRSDGRDSDGKCQGARECHDEDFSPSFDHSPVIVCLPSSTCNFSRPASLVPPNPQRLLDTINKGAQDIGTAAGAMAGAIATLPIGILLADPVKAVPHDDPPPSFLRRLPETV